MIKEVQIKEKKTRQSGLELLKIFGILLIVLSHAVQTLATEYPDFNYFIDITTPSTDLTRLALTLLRQCGILGNSIFFICSAWFLLDSSKTNFQKILRMVLDVWVISVLWLIASLLTPGISLTTELIIKSFTPIINSNNWYVTTYIIFCLIYPILNLIINRCNQKCHFWISVLLFSLFIVLPFIFNYTAFSKLPVWISAYFLLAYFKKYNTSLIQNKKANIILLILSVLGHTGLVLGTNAFGLYFQNIKINLLPWNNNANIFALIFAFSALNLFKTFNFSSKSINYISSLSLLIYILHENILFRQLYRPFVWQWIVDNFGYNNILVWVLICTIIMFICSILIAIIYKITLQRLIHYISDGFYLIIKKIVNFLFNSKEKRTNNSIGS